MVCGWNADYCLGCINGADGSPGPSLQGAGPQAVRAGACSVSFAFVSMERCESHVESQLSLYAMYGQGRFGERVIDI